MITHENTGSTSSVPLGTAILEEAELIERDAWADLFDAAPPDVQRAFGLSSCEVGGLRVLACREIPITEFNRAMAVGVGRRRSDEELDAAVRWLDQNAAPDWALQVAPLAHESLPSGFVARTGLKTSGSGWTKFVRSASTSSSPTWVGAVSVAFVGSNAATLFGETAQGGFELPPDSARWFAALVGRPGWSCFLSRMGDEPAGAAALYTSGTAAWLGICATLAPHRGRGVQGVLLEARVEAAIAGGAIVLTSETGTPPNPDQSGFSSYRNQVRAGFVPAYVRPNLKRTGPSASSSP